jgi:hypothetical protein
LDCNRTCVEQWWQLLIRFQSPLYFRDRGRWRKNNAERVIQGSSGLNNGDMRTSTSIGIPWMVWIGTPVGLAQSQVK